VIGELPKGLPHNAEAEAGSESEEIGATAGGRGVDVALAAAGAPAAPDLPSEQARSTGIPVEDRAARSGSPVLSKELTLKPGRRTKHRYPRGVELEQKGRADARSPGANCCPLEDMRDALRVAGLRQG